MQNIIRKNNKNTSRVKFHEKNEHMFQFSVKVYRICFYKQSQDDKKII